MTKSTLTEEQIEKFKKLEEEAANNTDEKGDYMDDDVYCLGNFAEDLCYAGDKEWARKIYKVVEKKLDRSQIDSELYINLAEDVATNLGDKDWARKIGATPKACSKANLAQPKNHYKYEQTCCGVTYKRHRLRKNARYYCPNCKAKLFK